MDKSKLKSGDQKTLRRLAQNREAAKKSRLRKKAYVQQLEDSRLRLTQVKQVEHGNRIFLSHLDSLGTMAIQLQEMGPWPLTWTMLTGLMIING